MTGDAHDFTDEQCARFYRVGLGRKPSIPQKDQVAAGHYGLECYIGDGWTIVPPPEPRYQAVQSSMLAGWDVVDLHRGGRHVAHFESQNHPDPFAGAQAEADRLNELDRP